MGLYDIFLNCGCPSLIHELESFVPFTMHARNACHHTSVKLLTSALRWVLDFPTVLYFV